MNRSRAEMADLEGAFLVALGSGDSRAAVSALLEIDALIDARTRGGEDSPDLDNARSTFRALIARLGEAAASGGTDPRSTVEPFVEALLSLRARARDARDWEAADLIRAMLTEAGVEVRDGAEGSGWVLARTTSDLTARGRSPAAGPLTGPTRLRGRRAKRPTTCDPFRRTGRRARGLARPGEGSGV